ncbi:MAG: hypothetical protein M3Q70_03275 [bacterium]|nr:hypothetical protein [bacterium]
MGKRPGELTLVDSALFMQLGEQQIELPQVVMPEMRVGRLINLGDEYATDDMNRYVNRLGQLNIGSAKVKAAGSLMVSFVTAKEAGRMMERRFPDLFKERRANRIVQQFSRLAKHYNQHVRQSSSDQIDLQNETFYANFLTPGIDTARIGETTNGSDNDDLNIDGEDEFSEFAQDGGFPSKFMFPATFDIARQPSFGEHGKNNVALVFEREDEELLTQEMEDARTFFKREGFDSSVIDRKQPHVEVVDAFRPLAHVALKGAPIPLEISLLPPSAIVKDNKPLLLR